jgi:DNA polymerase-1
MTQTEKEKIYLVDGSGYIFRAFYAVAPLTTREGFPTNALYGFTRMLGKLLKLSDSVHVVMVFDAGKRTFRNDLYEAYKANRAECPVELVPQMPIFRELSSALGLPVLELPGFEADDIIGTLSERFSALGHEVCIVTGDKDICQLVNEHVSIWDTMKDKKFGIEGVVEKFGVPPAQVVDVLALMGDSSDNVPGLSGVGPKTATQLVQQYGSVEAIITAVDQIKVDKSIRGREKLAENIAQNTETLRLCKRLVEILTDAPIELRDKSDAELVAFCERRKPDRETVESLFTRLEFTSLLKELALQYDATPTKKGPILFQTIFQSDSKQFLEKLAAQQHFAFDLETTSLDPHTASIVGMSFSFGDDQSFYVPFAHTVGSRIDEQISWAAFKDALQPIFARPDTLKIGQNIKFDLSVLAAQGVSVAGPLFCTMVAAYLLNPDKNSFGMTALASEYLGRGVIEYDSLPNVDDGFQAVLLEAAAEYAAEDALVAFDLYTVLQPLLVEKDLLSVFTTIEMPLVPVLSRMELTGVKVNEAFLATMSEEITTELEHVRERIINMVGEEFNFNSPKQLAEVLFTKLGISTKGVKKTKTGFSTDASVLEILAERHEVPLEILRHRTLFKLKSTYVDALPQSIHPKTKRIHSKFNQTVTATGRLSSSDPNLQNIPVQTPEGARIRQAFVAEPGSVILSADYSQIELRVLAHMSEDANLIDAFHQGIDIHTKTARDVFSVPPMLEVTSEQRRVGKTLNFGIIYGMGAFRLSKELGVSMREAEMYIQNYFNQYPGVKKLFAKLEADAMTQGWVATVFGRKRFIQPAEFSDRDKGFLNRIAVNAPIQGTAADIVKLAMINLDRAIAVEKLPLMMISQVHDELIFEAPRAAAEAMRARIQHEMEHVVSFHVPLKAEVGVGENWGQAH